MFRFRPIGPWGYDLHMRRLFLILLAAITLLSRPTSAAEAALKVGMELAYPPFEMRDESGAPAGVSVDLARALGTELGRPVEIENLPFDGLIPALKTGRIDLILSSMTSTPERGRSIDFSEPYLKTGLCLLVSSKSAVTSVAECDQKGLTIAVKKGTTGHLYATRTFKAARVLVLDKENACVLEVTQGKADAFVYDQLSTFANWQRHRDTTRAILQPFQEESWAIGVRKGNDPLREQVNAFLAKFRTNGGFDRLGDQWLRDQKAEFKKLGIPFYF